MIREWLQLLSLLICYQSHCDIYRQRPTKIKPAFCCRQPLTCMSGKYTYRGSVTRAEIKKAELPTRASASDEKLHGTSEYAEIGVQLVLWRWTSDAEITQLLSFLRSPAYEICTVLCSQCWLLNIEMCTLQSDSVPEGISVGMRRPRCSNKAQHVSLSLS